MANMWIRIAAGAAAIFTVGMVVVTGSRRLKSHVVDSAEPLTIPIPFDVIPLNVEHARIGWIRKLVIYRTDPKTPERVALTVNLADPNSATRFKDCILTGSKVEKLDENTTFLCSTAKDTAGKSLVPFGEIATADGSWTTSFLITKEALQELLDHRHDRTARITAAADSAAQQAAAAADSAANQAEAAADALAEAAEQAAAAAEAARAKANEAAGGNHPPLPVPPKPPKLP